MTEPEGPSDLAITTAVASGFARLPLLFFFGGFSGIRLALRATLRIRVDS